MAKHRIDDQSKNGRWGGPELVRSGGERPANQHPARHDRDRREQPQSGEAVAEDVGAG